MADIKVRRFTLLSGTAPGFAHVALGDAEDEENAQVWISARVPVEKRSDDKLALIVREALLTLQSSVDEGIKDVEGPPA